MKKFLNVGLVIGTVMMLASCSKADVEEENILRIATTTSLFNSGLLETIEEDFESQYPYDIEYIVVGSGAAIEAGEKGEADGIFVHSKTAEEELVENGTSLGRTTIMYNYFQIVGAEPLEASSFEDVKTEIVNNKLFVSRGDQSGTHIKELKIWGDELPLNYIETGKGMLDTLIITNELGGYTLTDDATFITNSNKFELVEVYKDDEFFKNEYSFHLINPELNDYINKDGAESFLNYLLTESTLDLISNYGVDEYGKALYNLSS